MLILNLSIRNIVSFTNPTRVRIRAIQDFRVVTTSSLTTNPTFYRSVSFNNRKARTIERNHYLNHASSSYRSFTQSSLHGKNHNESIHESNQSFKDSFLHQIKTSMINDILPTIVHEHHRSHHHHHSLNILLAVSGGCDSIALFHSILQIVQQTEKLNTNGRFIERSLIYDSTSDEQHIKKEIKCNLHVVHFDHQQRGSNSDGDRLFVKKLCHEYNIPFHCYFWEQAQNEKIKNTAMNHTATATTTDTAAADSMNTNQSFSQEIARNWRRHESIELLNKICRNNDNSSGILFTAHHKDDAEETMMMKFLRGVHITNLSGMDPILPQQSIKNSSMDEGKGNKPNLYIGKPMLTIRKKHIHQFLTEQGLEWREDESNKTDKYFRNRVRNQLMPLLQDLVGGEDILGNRLDNLQDQSRKIRKDIMWRAEEYLSYNDNENGSSSYFQLPRGDDCTGGKLNLVQEEALHLWIRRRSKNHLTMSYDKVLMITQQLLKSPQRREWKLSLGSNWYVQRCGDVLELIPPTTMNDVKGGVYENDVETPNHSLDWTIMSLSGDDVGIFEVNEGDYILDIPFIPSDEENSISNLYFQTVEELSIRTNMNFRFMPPWRNSEIKIKEFLRGQKVPLHRRSQAPILCADVGGCAQIVAVFVESEESQQSKGQYNKGRWVVNGIWSCDDNTQKDIRKCLITWNGMCTH